MLPDESAVLAHMRTCRSASGSVNLSDQYLVFYKNKRVMLSKKAVPRRFVPGNSAFKTMAGIPILQKDEMTKVPYGEREAMFRGVSGSAKWSPNSHQGATPAGPDHLSGSDDEDVVLPGEESLEVVNTTQPVVLYWMELHPRAPRADTPPFLETPAAGAIRHRPPSDHRCLNGPEKAF